MAQVVEFKRKEPDDPHIAGQARCIACANEWVSVAPIGTAWLECPSCKCEKGLMKYPCAREGKTWHCHCANELFYVTPEGIYCPNCGDWQQGF